MPRQFEDAPENIEEYENPSTLSQNSADPKSNDEWKLFKTNMVRVLLQSYNRDK